MHLTHVPNSARQGSCRAGNRHRGSIIGLHHSSALWSGPPRSTYGVTLAGPCPNSAALGVLQLALGDGSADNTSDAIVGAVASEVNRTDIGHLTGPLQREYSYQWQIERSPPIWKDLTPDGEVRRLPSAHLPCSFRYACTSGCSCGAVVIPSGAVVIPRGDHAWPPRPATSS